MRLWRISEFATLDGAGGLIVGGRWHSRGRPIVYTADSSALAMLEALIHLEIERLPPSFQLLRIEVPERMPFEQWPLGRNPREATETAEWGDEWLAAGRTALAKVPSVVAPGGSNWLLNPLHLRAAEAKIAAAGRWPWDERLFR